MEKCKSDLRNITDSETAYHCVYHSLSATGSSLPHKGIPLEIGRPGRLLQDAADRLIFFVGFIKTSGGNACGECRECWRLLYGVACHGEHARAKRACVRHLTPHIRIRPQNRPREESLSMGHVVSRYLIAAGRLARIDFESSSLVALVYNSLTDDSCLQARDRADRRRPWPVPEHPGWLPPAPGQPRHRRPPDAFRITKLFM